MATEFQTRTNAAGAHGGSPVFMTTGFLQKKCACGGSPGVSGECAECQKNHLQRNAVKSTKATEASSIVGQPLVSPRKLLAAEARASMQPELWHDFSRIQIYSRRPAVDVLPRQSTRIDAPGTITAPGGLREVFINGADEGSKTQPSSPARVKKDQTPPAKAASNCPTDIQVAAVSPANDVDFGKDGFLTGWGGIAVMEVSDPGGKTWDGTAIHENLKNIKNTCGNRGKDICSNKSGERGGTAGSTFKVGGGI